jgi:hypothetical protein
VNLQKFRPSKKRNLFLRLHRGAAGKLFHYWIFVILITAQASQSRPILISDTGAPYASCVLAEKLLASPQNA